MSTSNEKDTARDATDDLSNVLASEAPTDDNDDGEQKTMSMTKDRAHQNDLDPCLDLECCICLENLPKDPTKFVRQTCCGQGMHIHCNKDLHSMKMGGSCPLCRAKTPSSDEEHVKYLRPWVKKKKAWALAMMGDKYYQGKGVKQSYEMARRLYELAAQQGYANAMNNLGVMYKHGQGVEQSYEKAKEYYEQAAHLGCDQAQYNLGCLYTNGQGVEQDLIKARELTAKAAAQGHDGAINALQLLKKKNKKKNKKK